MLKLLRKKGQKGFTLIELMIVIAIIGILAAIAIPQFQFYRQRTANAAALSDAKSCYTAIQSFLSQNNTGVLPTAVVTADAITGGFRQSAGVTTVVAAGVTTSTPANGDTVYTIDVQGAITTAAK